MGPYSMDLRERVAAAIDEGEGSERQIAKRFRVSVSFVTRLLQRRRDAGTLAPKPGLTHHNSESGLAGKPCLLVKSKLLDHIVATFR